MWYRISGAVLGLVAAGFMQWRPGMPLHLVDDGLPLLFLFGGMLLAGRVAVDVAGSLGIVSAAAAAAVVGLVGLMVVKDTAAHGDSIDPPQVGLAALVVLLLVGGTAAIINWHRQRRQRGSRHNSEEPDASTEPPTPGPHRNEASAAIRTFSGCIGVRQHVGVEPDCPTAIGGRAQTLRFQRVPCRVR